MVSFLARLTGGAGGVGSGSGSSSSGGGDKDGCKTPSSSPTKSIRTSSIPLTSSPSSKSFIRLPRSSTRNQSQAAAAAAAAAVGAAPPSPASANPLPPLDLPSVNLLEEDRTTISQTALPTALPTSPLSPRISTSAPGVRSSTETTPWVNLDDFSDGNASERATSTDHEPQPDFQRVISLNIEDQKRLRRAMLSVEDVAVLVKECGAVIRERGLTTLGLFRPYRIGESRLKIDRLALLFYAFALDRSSFNGDADRPRNANDLFRIGGGNSKGAKLDAFKEDIKYANVHDVVGVLKWGLRHLVYSTSFAGKPSAQPLAWYDNFMLASQIANHPMEAFSTLLLPSLPPSSQTLLTTLLGVMQGVAAFTELNAMSAHRLSRQLGIYLFGLAPRGKSWTDWSDLYNSWKTAGNALEGCLRAYVRSQSDLPERLRELVEAYPLPAPRVMKSQLKSVIKVEIEAKAEMWSRVMAVEVNDQRTGLVVALGSGGAQGLSAGGIKRRDPVDILIDAFEAAQGQSLESVEQGTKDVWKTIVDEGRKDGEPIGVLSDETRRVLELVGLARGSSTLLMLPSSDDSRPQHGRQRSYSHGFGPIPPLPRSDFSTLSTQVSGSSPNRSVTHLSPSQLAGSPTRFSMRPSTAPQQAPRIVTPNWNDFASTGFSDTVPANEFGLVDLSGGDLNDFGLRSKTTGGTKTGGKPKDNRLSMNQRTPTSPSSQPQGSPSASIKPTRSLLKLSLTQIEDDFADVWLETLADPGACASWPSFLIAELKNDLITCLESTTPTTTTQIDHLLIIEKLVELRPLLRATSSSSSASIKGITRSVSIAESTLSRRWRRASQLFSGSGGGGGSASGRSTPTASSPVHSPRQSRVSPGRAMAQQPETIVEQSRGNSVDLASMTAAVATSSDQMEVAEKSKPLVEESSANPEADNQTQNLPGAVDTPVSTAHLTKSNEETTPVDTTSSVVEEDSVAPPLVDSVVKEEAHIEPEVETIPIPAPTPSIVVDEAPEVQEESRVEEPPEPQPEMEQVEPPQVVKSIAAPLVAEEPAAASPVVIDDAIHEPSKKLGNGPDDESPLAHEVLAFRGQDVVTPQHCTSTAHDDAAGEQIGGLHGSVKPASAVSGARIPTPHDDFTGGQIGTHPQGVVNRDDTAGGQVGVIHPAAEPVSTEAVETDAMDAQETAPQLEEALAASETDATSPLVSSAAFPAEKSVLKKELDVVSAKVVEGATPSTQSGPVESLTGSSPSSTTSKRFLGGVSDMLRRKSSAEKAQAKLEKEEEKKTQRELRQLKDEEKLRNSNMNKETKIPTPVSSVRARVLELEAERAKAEASVESPSRRSTSGSFPNLARSESGGIALSLNPLPESPTMTRRSLIMPPKIATGGEAASIATVAGDAAAVAVASGVSASPRPQESQHLAVKAPKTLDQLPSPLPSPTPVLDEECSTPLLATDPTPDSTAVFDHHPPQPDFGEVASSLPSLVTVTPPTPVKGNDPFIADSNGTPRAKQPVLDTEEQASLDVEPDSSILQPIPATIVKATTADEAGKGFISDNHPPASLPSSASDYSIAETATSFKMADSDAFFET
ncbi:BQ2448_7099 [Microbotryum intermedium]|uniref:BQ2448_7099 protein n=1 Tax=Microbotryum intermedium TaxID=269621 RepID=A0A238FMR6_9BASI|nr:BQ2448_7099 [Microbotryum intermedium]